VLAFKSLTHLLASKDTVLILKLDSGLRCQKYWALIPPATDSGNAGDYYANEFCKTKFSGKS
jgi:hypothetical protein